MANNNVYDNKIKELQAQGINPKQKSIETDKNDFDNNRYFEKRFKEVCEIIKTKCVKDGIEQFEMQTPYGAKVEYKIKYFNYEALCLLPKGDERLYKDDFILTLKVQATRYDREGKDPKICNFTHTIGLELKANKTNPNANFKVWLEETKFDCEPQDAVIIDESSIRELQFQSECSTKYAVIYDHMFKDFSFFSLIDLCYIPNAPIDRLQAQRDNEHGRVKGKRLYKKIPKQTFKEVQYKDEETAYKKILFMVIQHSLNNYHYDTMKTECHNPYDNVPIHKEMHKGVSINGQDTTSNKPSVNATTTASKQPTVGQPTKPTYNKPYNNNYNYSNKGVYNK